jgi:hypothetical protein
MAASATGWAEEDGAAAEAELVLAASATAAVEGDEDEDEEDACNIALLDDEGGCERVRESAREELPLLVRRRGRGAQRSGMDCRRLDNSNSSGPV